MPKNVPWSPEELLVAFRLYCRTPFGKLHRGNPEIIELARLLGRTPSAVSMKTCNFASLDPVHRARGVVGLGNAGRGAERLWEEFQADSDAVAANAEVAYAALSGRDESIEPDLEIPEGPTEILRTVRARRVQAFFRAAVLTSYNYRCALSDIALPELLNASHIIPWKADTARRADPRNGIALNALYDRAFDRGLITFDESFRVVLSGRVRSGDPPSLHRHALIDLEGQKLRIPDRFAPDPLAMAYHREHIFDCVVRT